jgi:hypothetical protein
MCEREADVGDIQASWRLWRSCGEVGVRDRRCCCWFDSGGGVVVISKSSWAAQRSSVPGGQGFKTPQPHFPI